MDFFSAARGSHEARNRRVIGLAAVGIVAGLYLYGRYSSPKDSGLAKVMDDASRGGPRPSTSRQENAHVETPYEAPTAKNAGKMGAGNNEAMKTNPGGNPGARPSMG